MRKHEILHINRNFRVVLAGKKPYVEYFESISGLWFKAGPRVSVDALVQHTLNLTAKLDRQENTISELRGRIALQEAQNA